MKRCIPFCFALLAVYYASAQDRPVWPPFPVPTKVLQDKNKFNAVTFGPGNSFSIREAPPDFQLDAFDFSSDGKLLFMEWASGRVEVRDIQSAMTIATFKPMSGPTFEVVDHAESRHLAVTGKHGVIRFLDPDSGKKLREVQTEIGKYKYDLQKIILAQDGSWVAYVNQENGKVLDLKSNPPKVLADLSDGYDIALTPDRSAIWVVNRDKVFGLKVGDWKTIGTSLLLDKMPLTNTATLAIVSSADGPVAFIPSQSGLLRYELSTLHGRKVTSQPAYWVSSDVKRNQILVNEFHAFSAYDSNGNLLCHWQQHPVQDRKVAPNGEWLGSRNFGKVELWSLKSLTGSCISGKLLIRPHF